MAIEISVGIGSTGIDHLHMEQLVRPVGGPSEGLPPQNPGVDASWGVIAADAPCCNGSADFPMVFPWELRRELQKPLSLTEISLNYFPPDNQPLSIESAQVRGRNDRGEASRADGCPPSLQACCRRTWLPSNIGRTYYQKQAETYIDSLATKIAKLQKEIEDRAGGLLDERDCLIQQRLWLRNELDTAGAG
ncbi:hypothetical protein Syncc8109_0597 [Synechococcus sp. WH 8109]|nr:hypothetical protein Syncc8109_0597 [Synechococcus sp. WH 8109]